MTAPGAPTGRVGFKRHLRVEVVKDEAVYLFSERGATVLRGSDAENLAPLLDCTRDLPTLLRDAPTDMAPEQVGRFIARLDDAGLLTMGPPAGSGADDQARAYWEAAGVDAVAANTRGKQVHVIATRGVDPAPARAALGEAGFAYGGDEPDLTVVLCDDYLAPDLADIDAAGRPWLLAKLVGARTWIGPVFDPPESGCWHCLASRLWAHREAEAHAQARLGRVGPAEFPVPAIHPLATMATNLMVLEVTKWLAGYRYPGQHSVFTLDSLDLQGRHHEFRRRPQCEHCGDPTLMRVQTRRPVTLRSQRKSSDNAGGHRTLAPQETLERYQHLISPITGVIKEITRNERGPAFFNSFRAGPNVAVAGRTTDLYGPRVENGGKGVTPLHGKVSALCEALERHSGFFHGDEERIRGSYRSLGDQAIHPATCQLYADQQYPNRSTWNQEHASFQHVPDPFDDNAVIDWTPVWSLTNEKHRLLPTAMLYYGTPSESGALYADSNGNAGGSCLEDAVLQGLLELVERDAVAIWWYNRTRQPAVDLEAFAEPWIDELRTVYRSLEREVWVLDVTADSEIPTMVALSRRTNGGTEDIMFGFGAHLDPRVALRRALTEMNQLMPVVCDLGQYGWTEPEPVHWWQTATVQNQPYLVPAPHLRPKTPGDYDYVSTPDLLDDVIEVRRRVESLGLEVFVLDQTRPDIGLPVVKVIVPGMRSFWARYAPGRLFDVPLRLGRLTEPTPYEELNPTPLFI